MSNAITIVNAIASLKSDLANTTEQLTAVDAQVNDLYHVLEYIPLSGVKMMKVTMTLKMALRKRRDLKENQALISALLDNNLKSMPTLDELIARRTKRDAAYKSQALAAFARLFNKEED